MKRIEKKTLDRIQGMVDFTVIYLLVSLCIGWVVSFGVFIPLLVLQVFVISNEMMRVIARADTVESTLKDNLPWLLFQKVMDNTNLQDPNRWNQYKDLHCTTVGMALCYLFNWKTSNEGEEFWEGVCATFRK